MLVWFVLKHQPALTSDSDEKQELPPNPIRTVLKKPVTWLITVVIMASYIGYLGSFYFTPYVTDAFGFGLVLAGFLASAKLVGRPISAIGAGLVSDRLGASKTIAIAAFVCFISMTLFALTPTQSAQLKLRDISDEAAFLEHLEGPHPVAAHLRESLDVGLRERLAGPAESGLLAAVLSAINTQLVGELIFDERRFDGVALRPLTTELMQGELSDEARARVNRLLIEDAFPGTIEQISEELAREGPPTYMLIFLVLNIFAGALCVYALRGVLYALLQEGGIQPELTGTATGVVSVLGYTPDIFFPPIAGYLLDTYPGGGAYRAVYAIVAGFMLAGFIAALLLLRRKASLLTISLRGSGQLNYPQSHRAAC